MKAVKSNPDPEWGAVAKSDKFLSGVCLNCFFVFRRCRQGASANAAEISGTQKLTILPERLTGGCEPW